MIIQLSVNNFALQHTFLFSKYFLDSFYIEQIEMFMCITENVKNIK